MVIKKADGVREKFSERDGLDMRTAGKKEEVGERWRGWGDGWSGRLVQGRG